MSDNAKMILRYLFTAAVMFAVGKGWLQTTQVGPVVDALLQFAAVVIALLPAGYAWLKVDNTPKSG